MPAPILIRSSFWEGSDPGWTLAQVVGKNGALVKLVDADSVDVIVYDTDDSSIVYDDGSGSPVVLSKGAVIFDTLQYAGTLWTEDDLGCNFAHYLDADTVFATVPAEGGKTYRIEYVIHTTTANGSGRLPVVNMAQCRPMIQT